MYVLSRVCAVQLIESPSSLVLMFYDLQRKIACCSDGTLAQDASPEPGARSIELFLAQIKNV